MRRALLTLALVIACKDPPPPPPPPAPAAPQDGVKLIRPGAEPRQTLRYHFTKGTRTASTLVYEVGIKSDGQGDPTPALVVELETVVDDVLADGAARLRFTLTRARLRDTPTADDPQVAALQGAVITEVLAPDGKSSGIKLEPGTATITDAARAQLDSLLQGLEHVTTQLPEDAVGVGAVWEERRTLPPSGITGVAETTYTVTAVSPTSFAYTSAGTLHGAPQTIEREGMKVEVSNTTGHAQAKGTIELARYVLDIEASSLFSSTMNAIVPKDMPGSGSSTVEITMATRMTPGAASASAPPGNEAFPAPGSSTPSASGAASSAPAAASGSGAPAAGSGRARPDDGSDQGAHSAP